MTIVAIQFLNLARKWPELMRHWDEVERVLPGIRTETEKTVLANKIKMITVIGMTLSLGESQNH